MLSTEDNRIAVGAVCNTRAARSSGMRPPCCPFPSERVPGRCLSCAWLCPQEPSRFLEQKCLRQKAALSVFTKRYPEWKRKSARADLLYIEGCLSYCWLEMLALVVQVASPLQWCSRSFPNIDAAASQRDTVCSAAASRAIPAPCRRARPRVHTPAASKACAALVKPFGLCWGTSVLRSLCWCCLHLFSAKLFLVMCLQLYTRFQLRSCSAVSMLFIASLSLQTP